MATEQYIERINSFINRIGTSNTIGELNSAYQQAAEAMRQLDGIGFFNCVTTFDDMYRTLNHITNYNIVRVANIYYDKFIELGSSDTSYIKDVMTCYDSIKKHEENDIEYSLLSDLCSRMRNNS